MADPIPPGAIAEEDFPVTEQNFHPPEALPNPDAGGTLFERIHAATVGNLPLEETPSLGVGLPVAPQNQYVFEATEGEEGAPNQDVSEATEGEEGAPIENVTPEDLKTIERYTHPSLPQPGEDEYANGGGVVPQGAIPEEDFQGNTSEFPNGSNIPPGAIPADEFYGTAEQQAKNYAEQFISGATLGASKKFETAVLGVRPEDIKGREEENPIGSFLANAAGTTALISETGGLGLLGENATLAGRVGIGALEGAGIGGVNQATDDWSQDKPLDAQRIAGSAGLGALIGAAGTAIVEGVRAKFFPRVTPEEDESGFVSPELGTVTEAAPPTGALPPLPKKPISSLDEAAARLAKARANGVNTDRPQAAVGLQAMANLDLGDFNPPAMQIEAIADPNQANRWNLAKELAGDTGDTIRGFESAQKQEIVQQLDQEIANLSPENPPTSDRLAGGERTNEILTDRYNEVEEATKPALQKIRDLDIDRGDHLLPVVNALTSAKPGEINPLSAMFEVTSPERPAAQQVFLDPDGIPIMGGGKLEVVPFHDSMHIEKGTYDAVNRLVGNLEDGDTSLEDLMHYRNIMGKSISNETHGFQGARDSISEIGKYKAKFMDYIQDYVQSYDPELQVREPLKAWAVNQGYKNAIEEMAGSVGKPELGVQLKTIPEKVNENIFRNSSSVQTVKNFLGNSDRFNEIIANYLAYQREKATNLGVFSSNNFGRFLKNSDPVLRTAFGENPSFPRIQNLTTAARIFPDAPPVNPSGTARTILGALKEYSLYPPDMFKELGKNAFEFFKDRAERNAFNAQLRGEVSSKALQARRTSELQELAAKTALKTGKGVKALIHGAESESRKRND